MDKKVANLVVKMKNDSKLTSWELEDPRFPGSDFWLGERIQKYFKEEYLEELKELKFKRNDLYTILDDIVKKVFEEEKIDKIWYPDLRNKTAIIENTYFKILYKFIVGTHYSPWSYDDRYRKLLDNCKSIKRDKIDGRVYYIRTN